MRSFSAEMDQRYKHILKLIEGERDSIANKPDPHYQNRSELLSQIENFYRTYKTLAERYEQLTGEVKKNNIPDDLQSLGSIGSDISADVIPGWSPQDSKISQRFLSPKKINYDTPSILSDSETEFSESDVSPFYGYSRITPIIGDEELQAKSSEFLDVHQKILDYEEELKLAKEKISLSEKEIADLKIEIQKFTSWEKDELIITKARIEFLEREVSELREENNDLSENAEKIQDLLRLAREEAGKWKSKIESQESDRENEVRDLKEVISKLNDEKIGLEEKFREREKEFHGEIEVLKADISEKMHIIETLEIDNDSYKERYENLLSEKDELKTEISVKSGLILDMEKNVKQLVEEKEETSKVVENLREEVEKERVMAMEVSEGKIEAIRQLCFSIEHYRNCYHLLRDFIEKKSFIF